MYFSIIIGRTGNHNHGIYRGTNIECACVHNIEEHNYYVVHCANMLCIIDQGTCGTLCAIEEHTEEHVVHCV